MDENGKMRICMLGQKDVPSRKGGVEVVVEELAVRMAALGHHITCYNRKSCTIGKAKNNAPRIYRGIQICPVFTIQRKGLAAVTSSIFASLYAALGCYDVVHYHSEGPCAMLWLPKLFGKHCVVTIHGIDWKREKWKDSFGAVYIHFGEKIAVRYADEIIVLSRKMQDYFQKTYHRKTRFIPNGVLRPTEEIATLAEPCFRLKKNSYILFLGRLVPEKGLQYLVRAFKQVKTEKLLVIAGEPSDSEPFVRELHRIAMGDSRILFVGFVQGKTLENLYRNAYLYVLPSDLEGMPLSLLEGMSYGNCCLTSDIAECREVVENKAILFQKSNILDLQEKLQMLCDNPNLVQKYRKNASDFICEKYNWDSVVCETIKLYQEILKG